MPNFFNTLDIPVTAPSYLAPTSPSATVAESFPRGSGANFQALSALTSGTLRLVAIPLLAGTVVTSVALTSVAAASSPTNQWFGLLDSSRTAIRFTGDDLTAAWAGNTTKTLALSSPYTVTASGLHYIAIMVAAGTPPTLAGSSSGNGAVPTRAPILGGSTSDTGLTGPPALPFTAGTITGSGLLPYVSVH